jgi:hypothetical protein
MNGTTTRARSAADARRHYGAHVDGANALQIGYADPDIDEGIDVLAPPAAPRRRPRVTPTSRPAPLAPPAPVALPRAPFLVMVVALVMVGVLGVLVLNTKINENSFVLDGLNGQQATLDLQEQQLSQELEDLESPGNLRAAAKRLGLVDAGTPAFISLPDGTIVGVPQPGAGATGSGTPAAGSDR